MQYNKITLGIANFSDAYSLEGDGALTADIRQKVFQRDDHSCQFCGFHSKKYQDVHHLDLDPSNIKIDNLVTSCIYCHQCFDLEKTAQMRSGVLIWMPEIEQTDLNHIARAIYVARISQGSMADTAKKSLEAIMKRREEAKHRLHTDDPFVLGHVMRDFLGAKHYAMRGDKLEGVRLFPLDRRIIKEGDLEFNQFPQILAYWRSKEGPFSGKIPSQWKKFYAQLQQAS